MCEPILCSNCSILIGKSYEYLWDAHGQDPPEDIFYNEDDVVFGKNGVYCSERCFQESEDTEDL